ncbi:hypothetical protein CDL12_07564 [Handroanthus impetiginosus]|uniref:TIR domain-containing protein n=1 Tax=Handroanthus impetiginosus TaxID=429701 RepID=A0A2G9HR18_9LAMI|nr:hypothetical protein CDL12_07564 [Handroanthus impetiginosus]
MQRSSSAMIKAVGRQILHHKAAGEWIQKSRQAAPPKNMKPGDKLFDKIDVAIRECKVGIAVFSPMYCDSYFCLHELSLMKECRKKIVPIFCDVKPSELRVKDDWSYPMKDIEKFRSALEEAKFTVGVTFDTLRGDWPEFLANATDVVIKNLIEVEEEELIKKNQ